MAKPKQRKIETDDNNQSPTGFNVSQSKVKTYRKCHYAYHLKYVEKLRKKTKSRPLQFGTIVHKMIEADAEGDDPMKVLAAIEKENAKMFRAEREMYGEIVDDVRQIMTEYFEYYDEKDLRFERRDGRSGEHPFIIDLAEFGITGGVFWNGKIDATGRTPNKLRWIVERKTFSRRPSDDERWRNLQSSTYLRAVDILGWGHYDGMCWDYIRSKSPTKPQLLKDGALSQKNIDSLPITIRETIAEQGLKERDYKEFIKRSENDLGSWFSRIHTPVNEAVVDHVFEDFLTTVREMADRHGKCKDRNIERHCSWCDFEPICRAEMQGDDVDYVKQREYNVAKTDSQENSLTDSAE